MRRVIFILLSFILVSNVLASTVTRYYSTETPNQCSELIVFLEVDVEDYETFYAIDEVIPSGWEIVNPGSGDTSEEGHIKWFVLEDAVDTTYQYVLRVPCDAEGFLLPEGDFMFAEDDSDKDVVAHAVLEVKPKRMRNHTLRLLPGWNLVSLPFEGSVTSSELKTLLGENLESIFVFDADWKYYIPTFPDEFNSLDELDYQKGFWVNMKDEVEINVSGYYFEQSSYLLKKGWNMVNYPFDTEKELDNYFGEKMDKIYSVYNYDGLGWKTWFHDRPSDFNDLKSMKPSFGYWVELKEDAIVNVQK